jgi:hypothetical protein|tara:strand:+ start:5445 stop:5933 length:489 start_codon:yes stop_codon:yes gene_type:complete
LATLVTTGRAGLAASVKARNIFLGIGAGQTAWDANGVDPENINSTGLYDAIGYRKAAQVDFVQSAAQGAISLPSGRYDVSATDTNLLYCKFTLDFSDASTSTIRETGIFLDVVTGAGLPAGQMFFDAATEVTSSGTLYLIEHVSSIIRTPATRETFEFVLTF